MPRTSSREVTIILLFLALFQSIQYFFFAEIPSGTKSIETARIINELLAADSNATIGIVDNSPVAALISADRKYQRTLVGNNAPVGMHPLSFPPEQSPAYMLAIKKNDAYQDVFEQYYEPLPEYPAIYEKKTTPFFIDQSH